MSLQPKKRTPTISRRILFLLLALYGVALATVGIGNTVGPERWWPSALNLYFPQWLWAVPGAILCLCTLLVARRWVWAPLLGIAWVAGPLMGLCWGNSAPAAKGAHLRIMTYNIKYGQRDLSAVIRQLSDTQPDLVFFQDTAHTLQTGLGEALDGWNIRAFGQYVIASRLPLSPPRIGSLSYRDQNHTYLQCTLRVGKTDVTLFNVHLISPRFGILAVRYFGSDGLDQFETDCEDRVHQAQELAGDIAKTSGPIIVAGDFNASLPSVVCRTMEKTGLRDAFAEAGHGYGYTYGHDLRFHHSYMRIDHVFVNRSWSVQDCQVGNAEGSDHRPVITDLILK